LITKETTMDQLTLTRVDVEKIKASAYKTMDRYEAEGSGGCEDMELIIEFCDLLLGHGSNQSVESFLSGQDMES